MLCTYNCSSVRGRVGGIFKNQSDREKDARFVPRVRERGLWVGRFVLFSRPQRVFGPGGGHVVHEREQTCVSGDI